MFTTTIEHSATPSEMDDLLAKMHHHYVFIRPMSHTEFQLTASLPEHIIELLRDWNYFEYAPFQEDVMRFTIWEMT